MSAESTASLESLVGCHGLMFVRSLDAEEYRHNGLPESTSEPIHDARSIAQQLVAPANDRISGLVLIGWSPVAVPLILADPYLRQKRIVWIVRPGDLRGMAVAFAGTTLASQASALPCSDPEMLPYLLEFAPHYWTHVVLGADWLKAGIVEQLCRYRVWRGCAGPARRFRELASLLARLPQMSNTIALTSWQDAYAGQTALCLAAGPSLDTRMDFIRAHQSQCVIIAVDVIANRLERAGIKVDFVLNVDPDDVLHDRMEVSVDEETVLVHPIVGALSLDLKFKNRSCFSSQAITNAIGEQEADFVCGTTVGVNSVGLARFFGCKEIILLGHDLAYHGDAYYSASVTDQENLEQIEKKFQDPYATMVRGNNGKDIPTNRFLEMAIHDLSIMLERNHDLVVFNPNINDQRGAWVSHVQPLPDGWVPRSSAPLCRPKQVPTLKRPTDCPAIAELIRRDLRSARAYWHDKLEAGEDPVAIHAGFVGLQSVNLVSAQLELAAEPYVRHHLRWMAKPLSTELQRQENIARLVVCLDGAVERIDRFIDKPTQIPADPSGDAEVKRFFTKGLPVLLTRDRSSIDEILLNPLLGTLQNLRMLLPEHPMPAPLHANDGLLLGNQIATTPTREFAQETACLCAIEGGALSAVVEWARTCSILPAPGGDDAAFPACIRATLATFRIRDRTSNDLGRDADLAVSWHPCLPHVLRALTAWPGVGPPVAERLLRTRRVVMDDTSCAQFLLHHPDYRIAVKLLEPYKSVFGEATHVAFAQREYEGGRIREALALAQAIRPLSLFRNQALAIAAECQLALGDIPSARQSIAAMTQVDLATHWHFRIDLAANDRHAFISRLASSGVLPEAALVAQCAKQIMHNRSAADAAALIDAVILYPSGQSGDHGKIVDAMRRFIANTARA
jgi:hypothetical protein